MSISPTPERSRIPGIYVTVLIQTVAAWDISAETLLEGSGISVESLNDSSFRVGAVAFSKLLAQAVHLTQEPGLAFFIGKQMKVSSHGLVGFTAMVASNLREAIEISQQFIKLQTPGLDIRLEVEGKLAYIYVEMMWLDLHKELDRLTYEMVSIYSIITTLEAIPFVCGQSLALSGVDFIFKRPAYFDRFLHVLDPMMGEVRCDQPYTRVIFPASFLDIPLSLADPISAKLMREQCQQELQALRMKTGIAGLVRELIYDDVNGMKSIDEVASHLTLSKRTLQRLLKDANKNFNTIYDDVCQHKALLLIKRKDLTSDQIAERLGYANSASFGRAFKRWTGQTPSKYVE